MFRLIRFPSILLLAAVIGCGESEVPPEEAHVPMSGTVDTSLAPDLMDKQQILKTIFDSLCLEGMGLGQLSGENPSLKFNESPKEFLEQGAINLAGWDFDGKPTGGDVPVILHLNLDSTGRNVLEVKRVYAVTGPAGRIVISRKQ